MEQAEEDLATSPARWKKLSSSRQIDHEVVVIPSPPVCKAMEELGREFLLSPVQSRWLHSFRPACVLSLHHSHMLI